MNYNEAIKYIHSIPKFSRILGNDLLRVLLEKLGNPQRALKFIHIGGTNGKGSVSTMTAEILKNAGYKVGLFTSPYLMRFNERIRINGEPISDSDLAEAVTEVKNVSEKYDAAVSEFAFITAVAFTYFKREKCDIVILEVGLGGRLDATNVIDSAEVVGITSIGYDHTQYLGDTIDKISKEKFGIIKHGSHVVLYPIQEPVVFKNAEAACCAAGAMLSIPNLSELSNIAAQSFKYKEISYTLAMLGEFQIYNAVCAIEIVYALRKRGFAISDNSIVCGLKSAKIDGRFEFLSRDLVIDGAHNPPAVAALTDALAATHKHIYFLTAIMQDKDYEKIADIISGFAKKNHSEIVTCEVDMPRCLKARELAQEFADRGINAIAKPKSTDAIAYLKQKLKSRKDALICVCGSLYLVGEIRRFIKNGDCN